jgi:hypothetical protein
MFLECNGEGFQSNEEDVVLKNFALEAGAVSEADYSEWLRLICRKKKKGKA